MAHVVRAGSAGTPAQLCPAPLPPSPARSGHPAAAAGSSAGRACCSPASSCINTAASKDQSIPSTALCLATRAGWSSCRCDDSLAAPQTCPRCPRCLSWHPSAQRAHLFCPALAPFPLLPSQHYCEISTSLLASLSKETLSHEVSVSRVSGHLPSAHLSSGHFMPTSCVSGTCQALGGFSASQADRIPAP